MAPDATMTRTPLEYRHVDVFADAPYTGNGLAVVFLDPTPHPAEQLRVVAEELRQFETIFVADHGSGTSVDARVFTVEEELPFAGHPVIGAAAALHERHRHDAGEVEWRFRLAGRDVPVVSRHDGGYFTATMHQGTPTRSTPLPETVRADAASSLGLASQDLTSLPLQVVSTGLPYLIVPVTPAGLERARIVTTGFEAWLASLGAKFVYVLDPQAAEGRTWDNAGRVEDVATGSAAGPAAAYLLEHGLATAGRPIRLAQGRFAGRPSVITVTAGPAGRLSVGGPVRPVAAGLLESLPSR